MHFLLEWCIAQIKKLRHLYEDLAVTLSLLQTQVNSLNIVGWVVSTNVTNLRLVPWATTHTFARLVQIDPGNLREWQWMPDSLDLDDGTDTTIVVKPFDRTNLQPGRWHAW